MEFKCIPCNKTYKSYQSLWNHNKKFHNTIKVVDNTISTIIAQKNTNTAHESTIDEPTIKNKCKYCNHIFTRSTSLKRHYNVCKDKESVEINEKRDEDMAR